MLILAAIFTIIVGLVHSWVGDKHLVQPLLAMERFPKLLGSQKAGRQTLRVAWHITTLFWFAIAAQMIVIAIAPDQAYRSFLIIMCATFAISTAIPIITGKGKHKSWIGFGMVTALLAGQLMMSA